MAIFVVSARHIPAINFWITAVACLMKNNDIKQRTLNNLIPQRSQ